jgi:hypothetical protein
MFFANHLTELGDEVIVLTSREEDFHPEQPIDYELLKRLHPRVRLVRGPVLRPKEFMLNMRKRLFRSVRVAPTKVEKPSAPGGMLREYFQAVKDFVTELITTPDHHAGWIVSCIQLGLKIVREQRPDVILATGGPWSGHLAGSILNYLTHVPLVLDFRDPWISNPDHMRRRSLFRKIDGWLERFVVGRADLLIANTEELREDFLCRYVGLARHRVVTITNGFEDYIFHTSLKKNNVLTLTHAGALYLSRNPRPLLEGARNALERGGIEPKNFRLLLLGGIEIEDPAIAEILMSPSLVSRVETVPRVKYEESLRAMVESDVLILYQSGFPLQIPRKLYDYMAAQKPILCIAEPGSSTWSLVERYSLGITCENNVAMLETTLMEIYARWKNSQLTQINDGRCEVFRNCNLAQCLHNQLEKIITRSRKIHQESTR